MERHKQAQAALLRERLGQFALTERAVPEDGNCQFHSLADQLKLKGLCDLTAKVHTAQLLWRSLSIQWVQELRSQVVSWLRTTGRTILVCEGLTLAEASGEQDWAAYCDVMQTDCEWGDHLTLLATCMIFQVDCHGVWQTMTF